MTENEVKKYINEVAFSGAEEFLEKYKDSAKDSGIIGHFGLGFYSAFMVSEKVEIITKSYKNGSAVHWSCDGSPEFSLKKHNKKQNGTEIILSISKDSKDYLEENKIRNLLKKYNRFMPVPIKFGTKEVVKNNGDDKNKKEEKEIVDDIINITDPAWTKQPKELDEQSYKDFYKELYPMNFEDPLFNIH
jgi:molecular chaperone HtpG